MAKRAEYKTKWRIFYFGYLEFSADPRERASGPHAHDDHVHFPFALVQDFFSRALVVRHRIRRVCVPIFR